VIVLLMLMGLAGAEFTLRSVLRSNGGNDFATPYVSAARFLHRANPYTSAGFLDDWHRAGAPADRNIAEAGQYSIYPPITLVLCAPFALMPWAAAFALYRVLAVASYLALVYFLAGKIGDEWASPMRLGFVAFALALTSVHAGIHQGNLSVLAFTSCASALLLAEHRHETAAGVLLALGFCLKPTSAPAVVLLLLLYSRKKTLIVALVAGLLIAGAAFLQMAWIGRAWELDYQSNLKFMFGPLGGASFITASEGRFDLLNLQVPMYALLRSASAANAAAWGIAALLGGIWLYLFLASKAARRDWDWSAIGAIGLIGLLPMYQRNYNIAIVLFALLWAFQSLHLPVARVVLLLCGFFLFPGEALIRNLGASAYLESNLASSILVMSQATWAVLGIVCALLYSQYKQRFALGVA
jgi:hypothetical protein